MSDLQSLPSEVIDLISTSLSKVDLLNLRSQSRTLRNGTTFEFTQRFIKGPRIRVTGSRTAIRTLTAILCNPDFSSAKVFSQPQALIFKNTTEVNITPGTRTLVPTMKDIDILLASLPRLQTLALDTRKILVRTHDGSHKKPTPNVLVKGREDLGPTVLKGLLRKDCTVSQLTFLDLIGCHLDSALLSKTLLSHKHSLETVMIRRCSLRRSGKKAVRWLEIFRVLSQLDLDHLHLGHLLGPGAKECVGLCAERTEGYAYVSHEEEDDIKHRMDGDVGLTGSAFFTRYQSSFTESHVKPGLGRLLKSQDLELHRIQGGIGRPGPGHNMAPRRPR